MIGQESFTVVITPDPKVQGEFTFELDVNLASLQRMKDVCATIYHLIESGDIHNLIKPSKVSTYSD